MYRMQRQKAFKISSASSGSDSSGPENFDHQLFAENGEKSLLRAELKNTTDRRLLLGIIERDNDLKPKNRGLAGFSQFGKEPTSIEMRIL